MKNLVKNILLLSSVVLMLAACKKDETRIVANSNATPPVVTATYENLVLNEADAAAEAIMFKWSKADYGYSAAVSYSVEVGKKDSSFVNAKSVSAGANSELVLTVGAFNSLLNQLNLVGFAQNDVEVRVKAEIGGGVAPVYSKSMPLVVTPYLDKPAYQTLYLVGDGTFGQWDNGKATPVFRDPANAFVFTFTGNFSNGNIKFLGKLGQWYPSWGSNGSGGVMFREKDADPDPANFPITAGYHKVTLNLRSNTYTDVPYDASGKTTYASIGIIGPFTDWNSIIPMTNTTLNPHIWTIDHTFASDTEMKFRIAEGWSVNWGPANDGTANDVYGVGGNGGGNFKVKAGSYTIIFNDMTAEYVFVKK
ncbi:SusE domain-containing protein [Mucilaginibacter sp. UR6-1]|uniref:SusE domain-containing protein n=1 Tax=Mucilaginibacter sp. UR6-1 TaxID=1435643 RepID=UPI001E6336B6|nr:SusE domain-containing protein [Mucilaginibacter sp. UR6-1]MCC8411093.1 SusE domain-containing protein [Mucilaginibacter sp. UR6-1]